MIRSRSNSSLLAFPAKYYQGPRLRQPSPEIPLLFQNMKSLSNLLFGLFCAGVSLAPGQEDDIPLGIEAVAGFRSDYVYRGFDLAQTTMDFQVETELVISDALSLGAGGWVATQLDDGFNEEQDSSTSTPTFLMESPLAHQEYTAPTIMTSSKADLT